MTKILSRFSSDTLKWKAFYKKHHKCTHLLQLLLLLITSHFAQQNKVKFDTIGQQRLLLNRHILSPMSRCQRCELSKKNTKQEANWLEMRIFICISRRERERGGGRRGRRERSGIYRMEEWKYTLKRTKKAQSSLFVHHHCCFVFPFSSPSLPLSPALNIYFTFFGVKKISNNYISIFYFIINIKSPIVFSFEIQRLDLLINSKFLCMNRTDGKYRQIHNVFTTSFIVGWLIQSAQPSPFPFYRRCLLFSCFCISSVVQFCDKTTTRIDSFFFVF